MTLSHLTDNTFVGIDVGGAGLDVAWHRGDSAHYANRPDAIATLVERLRTGPEVTRNVLEAMPRLGRHRRRRYRRMYCPLNERVSCCSCLVHEAEPAPGSSNVRPALATVRVSGPSIKRGGVRDPDGRKRPPINPATPASMTRS